MTTIAEQHAALYAQALGYPEAYLEEPWGHPAIKVRKKVFLFCSSLGEAAPSVSFKLPFSAAEALAFEGVEPTGYGLGKHGWCSLTLTGELPLERLLDWLDESFRAVAPKTVVKALGSDRPAPAVIDASPQPAPIEGMPRVLLVGAGPRRLERARTGLQELGIEAAAVGLEDALDAAGDLQPEAVVVDLGRLATVARPLVGELHVVCPDATVWLAGVNTKGTPVVEAPVAAVRREPPGDPAVVRVVAASL